MKLIKCIRRRHVCQLSQVYHTQFVHLLWDWPNLCAKGNESWHPLPCYLLNPSTFMSSTPSACHTASPVPPHLPNRGTHSTGEEKASITFSDLYSDTALKTHPLPLKKKKVLQQPLRCIQLIRCKVTEANWRKENKTKTRKINNLCTWDTHTDNVSQTFSRIYKVQPLLNSKRWRRKHQNAAFLMVDDGSVFHGKKNK